jgi:hypothetical protein
VLPGTAPNAPSAPGQQAPANQEANAAQPPSTDAFAQSPPAGGEAAQSALPAMIGDLPTYGVSPLNVFPTVSTVATTKTTVIPGLTVAEINQQYHLRPRYPSQNFTGTYVDTQTQQRYTMAQLDALTQPTIITTSMHSRVVSFPPPTPSNRIPVTSFGAFKISDNESAAPTDRVFATYNYFDADGFHGNASSINREVIGFEKTFFDGRASFEMRAPDTQTGESFGGANDFDGLTMVLKYAVYMDRDAGNVVSTGLAVTAPTGPSIPVSYGSSINPTLLQPYVGYAFNIGRFYLQGFSEIIVPTDSTLPTFIANDIGVGYRLESVPLVPTFEVHSNDALNHQGYLASPIGFVDSVILTGGVHILAGRSDITLGVAAPVSGPRLFGVEAVAQFNWRF